MRSCRRDCFTSFGNHRWLSLLWWRVWLLLRVLLRLLVLSEVRLAISLAILLIALLAISVLLVAAVPLLIILWVAVVLLAVAILLVWLARRERLCSGSEALCARLKGAATRRAVLEIQLLLCLRCKILITHLVLPRVRLSVGHG